MINGMEINNIQKELDFLWSGKDFKIRDYYMPDDPHIIRMTYGEAQLLGKYCKRATKGILEIGRFFGGSTYFIVASSPENIPVLSVDLKNHIKIYKNKKDVPQSNKCQTLKKAYTSNRYKKVVNYINEVQKDKKLTLLNIDSKDLDLKEDYDVVFIDGDHSYGGVKNDVEKVLRPSTKYIILHDHFEQPSPPGFQLNFGPDLSQKMWSWWMEKYGVRKYVNELISGNICKKIEKTHTMIVLEYVGESK